MKVGYSYNNTSDVMLVHDTKLLAIGFSSNPKQVYAVIDNTKRLTKITDEIDVNISDDVFTFIFIMIDNKADFDPAVLLSSLQTIDPNIENFSLNRSFDFLT